MRRAVSLALAHTPTCKDASLSLSLFCFVLVLGRWAGKKICRTTVESARIRARAGAWDVMEGPGVRVLTPCMEISEEMRGLRG